MTKTKSWKNTAAVKLFDFEFSKLIMWGTSKISQRKNSPFPVKHGKLKKVDMDHHKEDWQFSSKSLVKLKVSKAKSAKSNKSICDCIRKLGYLTKDVEIRQDWHFLFLFWFSSTNIHESQDYRGRGRAFH